MLIAIPVDFSGYLAIRLAGNDRGFNQVLSSGGLLLAHMTWLLYLLVQPPSSSPTISPQPTYWAVGYSDTSGVFADHLCSSSSFRYVSLFLGFS